MEKADKFILWFSELGIEDVPIVGGKNASLGEMYRNLTKKGVSIPDGFAVSATAYQYLVTETGLKGDIKRILNNLNTRNIRQLAQKGKQIRELFLKARFPKKLEDEIAVAYRMLEKKYGKNSDVAVRSSATAEDLPDASFAGQQETYLNITGEHQLLDACRRCFSSLFTNRAISYRHDKGFDHFKVSLSIGVQKMVRSDLAGSGIMFSIDTESGFRDVVVINATYGLGENIVQGAVNPDEYIVFKPTLKLGLKPILSKTVGAKAIKMVYSHDGKHPVKNIEVNQHDRDKFVITDKEILRLAQWAVIIEDHYSNKRGKPTPMDMEWAKDGRTGELFIVQARPETVQSRKDFSVLEEYHIGKRTEVIASGQSVGNKVGSGRANVIRDVHDIIKFRKGDVLVTDMTDPDWEPIMKIASGIVTNRGGRTCHAAIISREMGIPCIVGTNDGTENIRTGMPVTVSCAEGDHGFVYKGIVPFTIKKTNLKEIPTPRTKIMLNVGNPEQAFEASFIPNDGVGLARLEFIINEYIKIHPKALLHFNTINDPETKKKILEATKGYADKAQYFIDKLAYGVARIAAAFYPKDVIVRMSDFKSNEYANLIGGRQFEPKEDNPMIGWRGASRYYAEGYKDGFRLECMAMRKVREEMGLTNLKLMIPFCRTLEEGEKVLAEMKKAGLERGKNGLQVYVMCEIPSNVILADKFAKIFDGFSIGTNDLTQLTLGLDRDSELVSAIYDENNEAVKILVAQVIKTAKKHKRKIGLCGEAGSRPEFAHFLAKEGIDSVSVVPDAAIKTRLVVAAAEKR
ncbi:TPA: phosphoenolpyruvate synthase [Candidatus Woesearchaeota archaeon]|nr:phosphoenolpyruvate synthase [Candidatus Woesearchaeota archaeon]HII68468.1 phosphoenolpyruvate synthase [Candidatus Woesearchaeota archaeon]